MNRLRSHPLRSRGLQLVACLTLVAIVASARATLHAQDSAMDRSAELEQVEAVLDALHAFASAADGEAYFALFDPEAVYYGTDASERWSVDDFKAYAEPHFSQGRGWTYTSTERHVFLSPSGDCAWFDERLSNAKYGETRGSGVLVRRGEPGSAWRISQYNLSFPVPNALAADLVARIAELDGQDASEE